MNRLRRSLALLVILIITFSTIACSGQSASSDNRLVGKWAYNHEPDTAILELSDSGKAVYHGIKCTYTFDDERIRLEAPDGTVYDLRYAFDNDDLMLFEQAGYIYTGTGDPQDLTGIWKGLWAGSWVSQPELSSFEFTDTGAFREDGVFPGHFTVDKENGTIKLVYNDQFYDTVFYFSIDGDTMSVEYPWTCVRM